MFLVNIIFLMHTKLSHTSINFRESIFAMLQHINFGSRCTKYKPGYLLDFGDLASNHCWCLIWASIY